MAHRDSPWRNHRNAQPDSLGERLSETLANFGRERRLREDVEQAADDRWVERQSRQAARRGIGQGGQTSRHQPEKMSWKDKRDADRVLREGKPKRGKK